ncbi:MAG TPA: phosphoribosyltransferase [Burkholderiaceae bacterium]|nr:phosphoribosyltransferase [Burkholderiaceae bacterium]
MTPLFRDRTDAGIQLADEIRRRHGRRPTTLVLGLPRGGVPVAYEIARALHAPMDVLIVRKLGFPGQKEYAMGAIARDVLVLDRDTTRAMGVSDAQINAVVEAEQAELARREEDYRQGRPFPDMRDRDVILVDDGLATGATMRAAIAAARRFHPLSITVAAPVASEDASRLMESLADHVVCLSTPFLFRAVGLWYERFPQTSDDEVKALLARSPPGDATR